MRPALIGLTGYAQVGKDRVGDVLADIGYRKVAFGDKVRHLALRLAPHLDGDQQALQTLRDSAASTLGDDVWIDACLPRVSTAFGRPAVNADAPVVVVDVTTSSEARRIRNLGGVIWRVIRPGFGPADHDDEQRLAQLRPDETVCNTGSLSELDGVVRYMIARWQDPLEAGWWTEVAESPTAAVGSDL